MDILNALTLYFTRGTTNTAAALQVMHNNMFSLGNDGGRPDVAVLITDGRSNNPDETWAEARRVRK